MTQLAFWLTFFAMSLNFWVLSGLYEEAEEVCRATISDFVYWTFWVLWNWAFNYKLIFINCTAILYIYLAVLEHQ